jgi:CRISPR-associated protein Cas1
MRVQVSSSAPLKKQLWQQTVKAKIHNQATFLETLSISGDRLWLLKERVQSGDKTNCEAQAASHYWTALYGVSFLRGRNTDAPNAQLNYGYAILRSVVARALVASGMNPSIGIHHRNKYNAYCLADDIMEPYRPYVDALVTSMDDLEEEGLTKHQKVRLLTLPQQDVRVDGLKRPLFHAVSLTTASLYKCFDGSQRKIHYPEF